jgi:hypothetical protein
VIATLSLNARSISSEWLDNDFVDCDEYLAIALISTVCVLDGGLDALGGGDGGGIPFPFDRTN